MPAPTACQGGPHSFPHPHPSSLCPLASRVQGGGGGVDTGRYDLTRASGACGPSFLNAPQSLPATEGLEKHFRQKPLCTQPPPPRSSEKHARRHPLKGGTQCSSPPPHTLAMPLPHHHHHHTAEGNPPQQAGPFANASPQLQVLSTHIPLLNLLGGWRALGTAGAPLGEPLMQRDVPAAPALPACGSSKAQARLVAADGRGVAKSRQVLCPHLEGSRTGVGRRRGSEGAAWGTARSCSRSAFPVAQRSRPSASSNGAQHQSPTPSPAALMSAREGLQEKSFSSAPEVGPRGRLPPPHSSWNFQSH